MYEKDKAALLDGQGLWLIFINLPNYLPSNLPLINPI